MDKDLDLQIAEALRAYLASRVEEQVYYKKNISIHWLTAGKMKILL